MIRFIDLKDQIALDGTKEFAWYDTVRDRFIEMNGNFAWPSWTEFVDDINAEFPREEDCVEREECKTKFWRLFGWK